jgi:hypothetical protein
MPRTQRSTTVNFRDQAVELHYQFNLRHTKFFIDHSNLSKEDLESLAIHILDKLETKPSLYRRVMKFLGCTHSALESEIKTREGKEWFHSSSPWGQEAESPSRMRSQPSSPAPLHKQPAKRHLSVDVDAANSSYVQFTDPLSPRMKVLAKVLLSPTASIIQEIIHNS